MTSVLKPEAPQILSKEIEDRGLKRKYVAEKIGVSPNYFSQMMGGSRPLSTDVAIRAAQVLGLPVDIFLRKS